MITIINVSHDIITGNRMTAIWENETIDIIFRDNDRFFLVEIFINDKTFNIIRSLIIFLFILTKERNISAPTFRIRGIFLILSMNFVKVVIAKYYCTFAKSLTPTFMFFYLMKFT